MADTALPVVDRVERVDAVPGKALVRLLGRGDLEGRTAALVLVAGDRVYRYAPLPGGPPADGWGLAFAVPVAVMDSATAMAVDLGAAGVIPLRPSSSRNYREALMATEARLSTTEDWLAEAGHALSDRENRLVRLARQSARRAGDAAALEKRLTELRSQLGEEIERPPVAARDLPPAQADLRIAVSARRGATEVEELESRLRRLRERLHGGQPR